jgi:predicted metal-binding membrane protein
MISRATSLRQSVVPATAILIAAAAAWLVTITWAQSMGVMPGTMGMTVAAFIVMWTLMMAAMMLPSAMPMIVLYSRTIQTQPWIRMSAFGLGYILAWAATGVPAFILAWFTGRVAVENPGWATVIAVAIFGGAGVYQLTSLKNRCLSHCRSPLGHLMHYGNYRGRYRDLRAGAHHGLFCLGCCWALMVLMIAFGVMNLLAMVVLAAVIGIEKQWSRGEAFSKVMGVVALGLAVAVIFVPELAPGLDGSLMNSMGDMGM